MSELVQVPALVTFRGVVDVRVRSGLTGRLKRRLRFPNLVTSTMLDLFLSTTHGYDLSSAWIYVGSGTAAPTFTDTTISGSYAHTSTGDGQTGGVYVPGSPDANGYRVGREFGAGAATGTVGVLGLFTAGGASLLAACNPLDAGGSPTTIPVGPIDVLDVDWTILMQLIQSDIVESHTIAGASKTVTVRQQRASLISTTSGPSPVVQTGLHWGATDGLLVVAPTTGLVARTAGTTLASSPAVTLSYGSYAAGQHFRDIVASFSGTFQNFAFGAPGNGSGNAAANGFVQLALSSALPAGTSMTVRYTVAGL